MPCTTTCFFKYSSHKYKSMHHIMTRNICKAIYQSHKVRHNLCTVHIYVSQPEGDSYYSSSFLYSFYVLCFSKWAIPLPINHLLRTIDNWDVFSPIALHSKSSLSTSFSSSLLAASSMSPSESDRSSSFYRLTTKKMTRQNIIESKV